MTNENTQPSANESYETLVERLEEIVTKLEDDNLTLDQALASYETGVRLVQQCNDMLDKAELRITELSNEAPSQPSATDEDDDWSFDEPLFRSGR